MIDIIDAQMKLSGIGRDDLAILVHDEIERNRAAIAELTNRAISCEQSWTVERAERAELAIAELVGALRPFAKTYEKWSGLDAAEHFSTNVFPGDFRQASASVAKYDTKKEST